MTPCPRPATVLCLVLLCTSLRSQADAPKTIAITATPPAVQKVITDRIGNGTVDQIVPQLENGEKVFEVEFTKDAAEQDFTVTDDGTLLCVGVALADPPAAVQQAIRTQSRGWDIDGINKNVTDTPVTYDVTMTKGDTSRSFNFSENGLLNSVEMSLSETPAAVQAAIKTRVGDGSIQSIDEDLDPAGRTFDVEAATKDGTRKAFSIGLNGQLVSEMISLDEATPAARRTIHETVGTGKLLRLDRLIDEKNGNPSHYSIEARKDGHALNFDVGLHGRFLGQSN